MAWTAPRTWVTSEVVTAANMNTHVRDNLLETAPAKATAGGGYILATGANTVAQRTLGQDVVLTSEGTSSSSFTDLATAGPAVTITTGTNVLVMVSCRVTGSAIGVRPTMGYAVSSASTVSASEQFAFQAETSVSGDFYSGTYVHFVTGLTAGSNVFTAKYCDIGGTGTATFANRRVYVLPAN